MPVGYIHKGINVILELANGIKAIHTAKIGIYQQFNFQIFILTLKLKKSKLSLNKRPSISNRQKQNCSSYT